MIFELDMDSFDEVINSEYIETFEFEGNTLEASGGPGFYLASEDDEEASDVSSSSEGSYEVFESDDEENTNDQFSYFVVCELDQNSFDAESIVKYVETVDFNGTKFEIDNVLGYYVVSESEKSSDGTSSAVTEYSEIDDDETSYVGCSDKVQNIPEMLTYSSDMDSVD